MPSFLNLTGSSKRKNNPYLNPHHPGHNPTRSSSSSQTTTTTSKSLPFWRRSTSQPNLPPRPASPRTSHDYLAEARLSAGRNPITGQRHAANPPQNQRPVNMPLHTVSESNLQRTAAASASSAAATSGTSSGTGRGRDGGGGERSAYLFRASQTKVTMGARYDLYAMQCQRDREEQERLRSARGGVEYYAPERRVSEFYSGPVRD